MYDPIPAGLSLAIVGLAILCRAFSVRSSLRKAKEWIATEGTIVKSEVSREENGIWSADILYKYKINGEEYESEIVNLDGELRIGFSDKPARRRVEKYVVGTSVIVYVNPENMTMSFLETVPSSASRYQFTFGGILAVVGMGILVDALVRL